MFRIVPPKHNMQNMLFGAAKHIDHEFVGITYQHTQCKYRGCKVALLCSTTVVQAMSLDQHGDPSISRRVTDVVWP